ncbi:MAG TPA: phosphoglycerate mutase [Arenimonas sp.]|nr:phosphoglycerate mutase [Arenimonas sp.]
MPEQERPSTLLLPARQRLAGQALPASLARRLGHGRRLPEREPGGVAQLQRHFEVLPRGWPMAAITRARDAGDAGGQRWLRADPAHVRPDMTGARVLAIGELGLSAGETEALLQTLRPLFGDAGMQLSAPAPSRWYLALAADAPLPDFPQVEEVLGADLFDHLPEGPEGRRWRSLLNEAQILLHNHPVNQARAGAGKPVANSLCFWGGGRRPDRVASVHTGVASHEAELLSLAALAGVPVRMDGAASLLDLRILHEPETLAEVVEELLQQGRPVCLDFADGAAWQLAPGGAWRFWRRPQTRLT